MVRVVNGSLRAPKGPNGNDPGLRPVPPPACAQRLAVSRPVKVSDGTAAAKAADSSPLRGSGRVSLPLTRVIGPAAVSWVQRCGVGSGQARMPVTRAWGCPLLPKPPHPR
ncbi:hypothetical protein GCM10009642_49300 [Nocardiopsis metallicus]